MWIDEDGMNLLFYASYCFCLKICPRYEIFLPMKSSCLFARYACLLRFHAFYEIGVSNCKQTPKTTSLIFDVPKARSGLWFAFALNHTEGMICRRQEVSKRSLQTNKKINEVVWANQIKCLRYEFEIEDFILCPCRRQGHHQARSKQA